MNLQPKLCIFPRPIKLYVDCNVFPRLSVCSIMCICSQSAAAAAATINVLCYANAILMMMIMMEMYVCMQPDMMNT